MKVRNRLAKNITTEEAKKFKSLSLRSRGYLAEEFEDARYSDNKRVFWIEDEEGKVLSWGLLNPISGAAGFYTRASERGKGYGTQIAKSMLKWSERPVLRTMSWSEEGYKFFEKMGFDNTHETEWGYDPER